MGALQPLHIAIIIVAFLLLFAAPKLPQITRNFAESVRVFRSEMKQMKKDEPENENSGAAAQNQTQTTGQTQNQTDASSEGTITGKVVDGDSK